MISDRELLFHSHVLISTSVSFSSLLASGDRGRWRASGRGRAIAPSLHGPNLLVATAWPPVPFLGVLLT